MRGWWLWLMMGCSVDLGEGGGGVPDAGPAPAQDASPEDASPADVSPEPGSPEPPHCMEADRWRLVRWVHQAAEDSVHELVTCGQAQMATVGSMVAIVLFSNREFFDEATVDELEDLFSFVGLLGASPFMHQADGRHVMPINERSTFEVAFYAPGAEAEAEVLRDSVFDLESYVQGARVQTSLSWQEMKNDYTRRNVYRVTWETPGPLARVMFPEGVPAEGTFEVALSLWDFAYLLGFHAVKPDFGPFAHLSSLVMDSNVSLHDDRVGVTVDYVFGGERGVLTDLLSAGQLGFALRSLRATDGQVTLAGDAADLRYLSLGTLAGRLVYRVPGDDLHVVDDFGEGAGYPETGFYCPADWPPPEHVDLAR